MTDLCNLLEKSKKIAVVGISRNNSRTSRSIADFLVMRGYEVVGVNPGMPKIPGIPVYKSLKDIPFKIDIVDVFRKSEDIPELIPDVLEVNPNCFWLQLGIQNNKAVKPLIENGIIVVQNKCIKIEYLHCY
ncbi:MAG: CoA-binding protein [Melioribacteraceae bacterium]|nr:CoA-binding protein [Melioribacteraceae bacterium]